MVFNSFEFIGYLIIVLIITYVLNKHKLFKSRNTFLLIASWVFYGSFNYWFLLLLGFITIINYFGAVLIEEYRKYAKTIETSVIILSIGQLALMKYAFLYNESILLPVGLSFFTFQALSYSIDVYRKKIEASRDFVKVSLFISFLPTILSGPIERATNLFPQLESKTPMNYDNLMAGIRLFIWGLFKKLVIADRLAIYVNQTYATYQGQSGSTLALAAIFYSIQIYCDFSGYADMAIGVGRILGFKLMENFKFPYFSKTIKQFWRKWHISLTSWFTEYVYFSLGGNRVVKWRWIFNILCIFVLSGIWHGATMAFLIWGLIHGIAYLIENFMKIRNGNVLYGILCFVVVTLAWIFFRVETFSKASDIIGKIFTDFKGIPNTTLNGSSFTFYLTMLLLVIFMIREYFTYKDRNPKKEIIANLESSLLLLLVAVFGVSGSSFVYFQF